MMNRFRSAIGVGLLTGALTLACGAPQDDDRAASASPEKPASSIPAVPRVPAPDGAPHVLLITIDTLRADHIGCYGHARPVSPNLDALARRGVRFADASVQWPKTWPSMASLLTGAYPQTTGLGLLPRRLPEELVMLSEVLGRAGYATAAVVANFNVGKTMGFQQGFDHFVESWQEGWRAEAPGETYRNRAGRVKEYTNAKLVTDQALRWLEAREAGRPFFLWLHYMDPHGPYLPPAETAELFADSEDGHARPKSAQIPLDQLPEYQRQERDGELVTDLDFYTAQYDREIRYLDGELGRLFENLADEGLLDRTLIVLTADHGESFGEHDYYLEHGKLSYQATAAVPLIVALPNKVRAGVTIEAPVGVIDIAPTVVELAGLPIPADYEGQSLVAVLDPAQSAPANPRPEPAYLFMESGYRPSEPQLSVRHGKWKLIWVQSAEDRAQMTGSLFELYDLALDPHERRNVVLEHPDVVTELSAALREWRARKPSVAPGSTGGVIDRNALDEKSRQMLQALGYLETETGARESEN